MADFAPSSRRQPPRRWAATARALLPGLLALAIATSASAQSEASPAIVRSTSVDHSSVTVYRAPSRSPDEDMDLDWLEGLALISETRTVTLPAGRAIIRFEGVADGAVAVSALVSGLPGEVILKDRDAALLSPGSLLDGSLGNRVTVRRTNRATGAVTEEQAIIRTGLDGAVVFQTRDGLEALRCSGLPETIIYPDVPAGLSDRPVMSVTTDSPRATTATITLTYLASGFDWSADYVLRIPDDSDRADLFGWMTIANANGSTFADAQLLGIAGELNIESDYDELGRAPDTPMLDLQCYPMADNLPMAQMAAPPPPGFRTSEASIDEDAMDIVVTAQMRTPQMFDVPVAITATEEGIGTLRMFRVPFPTTVAAHAQKQVAFLDQRNVRFRRIYSGSANEYPEDDADPMAIILRIENRESEGLGRSLPQGRVTIMGDDGRLINEDIVRDSIPGLPVDFDGAETALVRLETIEPDTPRAARTGRSERIVTVSNDNGFPIDAEIRLSEFDEEEWDVAREQRRAISMIRGQRTWVVTVPAHGTARLNLRERKNDD